MGFNDFLNLLSNYGTTGSVLVALAYIIRYVVKTDWFGKIIDKLIDNLFKKKDKKSNSEQTDSIVIDESKVANHEIFIWIDIWINTKIPSMVFSNDFRTAVFRKYLTVYLMKYKENLKEFINNKKYQTMDETELLNSLFGLINKTIYDYESELVRLGVPTIVIERMKIKNNESILLTIDLLEGICSSDFYKSEKNVFKILSILNTLFSILTSVVNNSLPTCNGINGAMQGMTFQGYMEPYH